jgi:hypothetical protein
VVARNRVLYVAEYTILEALGYEVAGQSLKPWLLVYEYSLVYSGTHFSLLGINELNKIIHHYDSIALTHVIASDINYLTRVPHKPVTVPICPLNLPLKK